MIKSLIVKVDHELLVRGQYNDENLYSLLMSILTI